MPFHEGGYRGGGKALAENFSQGGYVGVPMLALWGLTHEPHRAKAAGLPGYPHMLARGGPRAGARRGRSRVRRDRDP